MVSSMRCTMLLSAVSSIACSSDPAVTPTTDTGMIAIDSSAEGPVASEAAVDSAMASDIAGETLETTFGAVYTTLYAICVDCHKPEEGPEGELDLSSKSTAYAQLVGVAAAGPACGSATRMRVVAGDPSASLLFQKVSGAPPCGDKMPPGPAPLEAKYLEQIRAWIAAGARDD